MKYVPYTSDKIKVDTTADSLPKLYIEQEDTPQIDTIIFGSKAKEIYKHLPYIEFINKNVENQNIQYKRSEIKFR